MKDRKSIKTYASTSRSLYKLVKQNINDAYFIEVLYYHARKSLILKDFNLYDLDGFRISGKYLGFDVDVELDRTYDNVIRSLNLVLSLRAFMLNSQYLKFAYDNALLFYHIDQDFLAWESHRVIMECMGDEDFASIYNMIVCYKNDKIIPDEQKATFKENTIDPGYRHLEEFCKILAARDEYHGKSVIKNTSFLCDDIEEFVVNKGVEYIGDTAFAYCENLKEVKFEGKVLFGIFPIIECKNLKRILVPTELLDYYKASLPYYKSIITDNELEPIEEQATNSVLVKEVKEEKYDDTDIKHELTQPIDDTEIEHVYVGVPSADPYTEVEVDSYPEEDIIEVEETDIVIEPKVLSSVFDKKATSYKYFWFLSLISLAKESDSLIVSYKDIIIRMAALAWPIVMDAEIDLGNVDMLSKYLTEVSKKTKLIKAASSNVVETYMRQHYSSQGIEQILAPLLKNVPYRFLSPWIPFTTTEEVIDKSKSSTFPGLYALHDEVVVINKKWWDYILQNYVDICDFAKQSFITYAKQYNNQMKLLGLMSQGWSLI